MWSAILRHFTWVGARRGSAGSRIWMIVTILVVGARTIRRMNRSEPEVLYRTKIRPGEILVMGSKESA